MTITKATQAVSVGPPPASPTVGGSYTVAATGGGSGNPVLLSIDSSSTQGACSLTNQTVSFTGVGSCVIDASQGGNTDYLAGQAQQSLTVGQGSQSITFTSSAPTGAVPGGPTYTPSATGGASGGPVVFSIDSTSASVCSIAQGVVSFLAGGTCVIDANQAGNANNGRPQATILPGW